MSFNKRYYSIKNLKEVYNEGGIEGVQKLFTKIDAHIFNDKKSSEIHKHIINNKLNKAIKILKHE